MGLIRYKIIKAVLFLGKLIGKITNNMDGIRENV